MGLELLTAADKVLDACGRRINPDGSKFIDLPRAIGMQQNLVGQSRPFTIRLENTANTIFLVDGITVQGSDVGKPFAEFRVKWPNGRFLSQNPSQDPSVTGFAFPAGAGPNQFAFNKPQAIEAGGRLTIEFPAQTAAVDPGFMLLYSAQAKNDGSMDFAFFARSGSPLPSAPINPAPSASAFTGFTSSVGPFVFGNKTLVILETASNTPATFNNVPPSNIQAWMSSGTAGFARQNQAAETTLLGDANFNPPPAICDIAAVQSTLNPNIVYVAYWKSTGAPSSTVIALRPFDMNTGLWGTEILSTLGITTLVKHHKIVIGYRAVDDCVIVASGQTTIAVLPGPTVGSRAALAKCFPNGAGWDVAWTAIGDTSGTLTKDSSVEAGVCDAAGNFHFIIYLVDTTAGPAVSTAYHQVFHPGGSLTVYTANVAVPAQDFGAPEILILTPTGLGSIYFTGPGSVSLLTANGQGDTPAWASVPIFTDVTGGLGLSPQGPTVAVVGTKLQGFLLGVDGGGNTSIFTSSNPLGASTLVGAFPASTPFNLGYLFALGTPGTPGTPGTVNVTFWGRLRYLLKGGNGGGSAAGGDCIVGYPSWASGAGGKVGELSMVPDPRGVLDARPRFICGPNQNTLAPEWMLGNQDTEETPPGYEDESYTLFSAPVVVAVGKQVSGFPVVIPGVEDVIFRRMRALVTWDMGVTGSPTFGLRLPSGYSFTGGDQLPLGGFPGFSGYFAYLAFFPRLFVRAGDRLILDVANWQTQGVGNITTVFEFDGIKRRRAVNR